jgi:hypothetical protein
MLSQSFNDEMDRIQSIKKSAAKDLKVDFKQLEAFFSPPPSIGFWREFWRVFKFQGYSWDNVQAALNQARSERMSSHRSGISRKDDWLPQDCGKALKILVMLLLSQIRNASC